MTASANIKTTVDNIRAHSGIYPVCSFNPTTVFIVVYAVLAFIPTSVFVVVYVGDAQHCFSPTLSPHTWCVHPFEKPEWYVFMPMSDNICLNTVTRHVCDSAVHLPFTSYMNVSCVGSADGYISTLYLVYLFNVHNNFSDSCCNPTTVFIAVYEQHFLSPTLFPHTWCVHPAEKPEWCGFMPMLDNSCFNTVTRHVCDSAVRLPFTSYIFLIRVARSACIKAKRHYN